MKKINILVFTNHYPFKDLSIPSTNAVHYFTKEWVNQGHRVLVVHHDIELFGNREKKSETYLLDGVEILYIPVTRYIPKFNFLLKTELKTIKKRILDILKAKGFKPDKFIVHFCSEQWQIVETIRNEINCVPVPIFHNIDVKSKYKVKKIIKSVSQYGYRSNKINNRIISITNNKLDSFQVYSGAPDYVYKNIDNKELIKGKKKKLLYVGNLIPLKKVDDVIKALALLKDSYDFEFTIIGSGESEPYLKELTDNLGLQNKVIFNSRMPRAKVIKHMRKNGCFVMVSQPETLGVVYIEAMASGCFVIGSKGEGIDGIIKHEYNGLLVEPGNIIDLKENLEYYFNLSSSELDSILSASKSTSLMYKESGVAQKYLENLE